MAREHTMTITQIPQKKAALAIPQVPQQKALFSFVPTLLVFLSLAVGGGCVYWFLSDSAPAWMSALLPSSSYQSQPAASGKTQDSVKKTYSDDAFTETPQASPSLPAQTAGPPSAVSLAPQASPAAPVSPPVAAPPASPPSSSAPALPPAAPVAPVSPPTPSTTPEASALPPASPVVPVSPPASSPSPASPVVHVSPPASPASPPAPALPPASAEDASVPPTAVSPEHRGKSADEGVLHEASVDIDFADDIDTDSPLPASAPPSERGQPVIVDPPLESHATDGAKSARQDAAGSSKPARTPGAAAPERQGSKTETRGKADASTQPDVSGPSGGGMALIRYGKGKSLSNSGSVAEGEIPQDQRPLPVSVPALTADSRRGDAPASRALPVGAAGVDSVVGVGIIDDLAAFLAENYWPLGTHPLAKDRGISTAGLKWANAKYGGKLQGFSVNPNDLPRERARVLRYVYMPSMIQGLYALYGERFFTALERNALAQRRGPEQARFTNGQMADMFGAYAAMARGLAGCVRAYANTPDIRSRLAAYMGAVDAAEAAYARFSEASQAHAADADQAAHLYQAAVVKREQQRENVAAAMRRGGATSGLDTDAVVYTAMWLQRRGAPHPETLRALSAMFDSCAKRLGGLAMRYRAKPAGKSAGEWDN